MKYLIYLSCNELGGLGGLHHFSLFHVFKHDRESDSKIDKAPRDDRTVPDKMVRMAICAWKTGKESLFCKHQAKAETLQYKQRCLIEQETEYHVYQAARQ